MTASGSAASVTMESGVSAILALIRADVALTRFFPFVAFPTTTTHPPPKRRQIYQKVPALL